MSIEIVNQKRYIELNSAYRNRNDYPNPAQFKVNVANAGQRLSGITALDPVSLGQPVLSFGGASAAGAPANPVIVSSTMEGTNSTPRDISLTQPDDYYEGLFMVDTSKSNTSAIVAAWNNNLKTFTLETPFGNAWASGDSYTLSNPSDGTNIWINLDPSNLNDTFVGQYLYNLTKDEYRLIIDYNPLLKIVTLESAFTSWDFGDYYDIVSQQALRNGTAVAYTRSTVTLDAGASSVDGEYVGQFVRLTENAPTAPDAMIDYGSRVITTYNGTTKVATFAPPIDNLAGTIRFQVLQFTRDEYSFLNYVGRETRERAYYRLTLDNLILPNQTLDNRFGSSIAFYPYVYLVFSNDSIGVNSLLNSNNPNSQRAVFRCPITDTPNPDLSTFVKIRSTMINVMRFSPWEDLKFEVYLPDGTLFKTIIDDTIPPERPNPGIQISCTVAFERL